MQRVFQERLHTMIISSRTRPADTSNFALDEDNLRVEEELLRAHLIESLKTWVEEIRNRDRASAKVCASLRNTDVRSASEEGSRGGENPPLPGRCCPHRREPLDYASKTRCCGAALIITNRKARGDGAHPAEGRH